MNNFSFDHVGSDVLALHVVAYKVLGLNKDLAMRCMAELGKRRQEQIENFDFEAFIDKKVAELNQKKEEATAKTSNLGQKIIDTIQAKS